MCNKGLICITPEKSVQLEKWAKMVTVTSYSVPRGKSVLILTKAISNRGRALKDTAYPLEMLVVCFFFLHQVRYQFLGKNSC